MVAERAFGCCRCSTVAALTFGAAAALQPAAPGPAGSAGPSGRCRRRCAGVGTAGAEGEPPDPRRRGGQVQRRDGPHRTARRRRLEPGPLRGPAVPLRERARTPTSRTSRTCPRAPTPSRSSAAWRARASTSSSAPRSATWTPWPTVAEEFPDTTFLHLTGYKSNGKNFGNFFGAMEDFKYLAGMLAGSRAKKDGNPKIGYMATFPIPEELRLGNAIMLGAKQTCPECTMDVRCINTWHDPVKEKDAAARCSTPARRSCSPAPTRRPSPTSPRRRASGASPTTTRARARSTLPHRAVLDLGSRVRPHRRAGQGQDLQGRLRVLRRRLEGDGPARLHGRPDAAARASPTCRPPTSRRSRTRWPRCWPASRTASTSFAGPIKDNTGKEILAAGAKLEQSDLDQFPPGAPGNECKTACTGGPTASPSSCRRSRNRMRVRRSPTGGPRHRPSRDRAPIPARRSTADAATRRPPLEARGIVKRFPGVLANDEVDFDLRVGRGPCRCSARTAPARARS